MSSCPLSMKSIFQTAILSDLATFWTLTPTVNPRRKNVQVTDIRAEYLFFYVVCVWWLTSKMQSWLLYGIRSWTRLEHYYCIVVNISLEGLYCKLITVGVICKAQMSGYIYRTEQCLQGRVPTILNSCMSCSLHIYPLTWRVLNRNVNTLTQLYSK